MAGRVNKRKTIKEVTNKVEFNTRQKMNIMMNTKLKTTTITMMKNLITLMRNNSLSQSIR